MERLYEEEEENLGASLDEKPERAKLAAQLSMILTERAKTTNDEDLKREALVLARRGALLSPTKPAGHLALSTASQHHEERMRSLQKAVDLWNPSCSMTKSAVARSLVRLLLEEREEEARILKDRGVSKSSLSHPSRRNLNEKEQKLYERMRIALENAWEEGCETLDSTVDLARAEYRLGALFRKMEPGNVNQPRSIYHFSKAVEKLPEEIPLKKTAKFWLASVSDNVPEELVGNIERCPQEYIVSLYSKFAENFDSLLVGKLNYQTPQKLRKIVVESFDRCQKWAYAADLGCGTGLSGMAFRDCVNHMVGVDLSPEMIEKARLRECYDHLSIGDITSILISNSQFDLVFSCDVFVYIGKLREVFAAVKNSLRAGGVFAFSCERLEETHPSKTGYNLHAAARFAHKESYMRLLALDSGFDIVKVEVSVIRQNGGKPVSGILAVLRNGPLE
jgi:predicted TPR repeat methyltransferase